MTHSSNRIISKPGIILLCLGFLFPLTSCFTGVEGTQRVEMNKNDVLATLPAAEDRLVDSLKGLPLQGWKPGMRFVVLDDRAALMFDPQTLPPDPLSMHLANDTLQYISSEKRVNAALDTLTVLIFRDKEREFRLPLKNSSITSMNLPMMVDADVIDRFNNMLAGKTLWVKNPLWLNSDSLTVKGLKYSPVKISKVRAGVNVYPARICFSTDSLSGWLPVSLPESGPAARNFSQQFSLTDPRGNYPGISNETWHLIQRQQLAEGMTKTEARLALGNPKDVSQGHNSALLYELWQYPDGSYLMFEDGLLLRFKQAR